MPLDSLSAYESSLTDDLIFWETPEDDVKPVWIHQSRSLYGTKLVLTGLTVKINRRIPR